MELNVIKAISDKFTKEEFLEGDPHIFLKGDHEVMFSAAHAVSQIRNGRYKKSETYTGVLAKLLNSYARYPAIVKTRNLFDDANYDPESFYRQELIDFIKVSKIQCLIDLHIMKPSNHYDIEMATGNGVNIQGQWWIINEINGIARGNGIEKIATDENFFALNPNCIAADISKKCGIPAIQMEINWKVISDEKGFTKIYSFLKELDSVFN
ncbi:hypothetical protein LC085_12260 [Bacillus tianshenii]|uniref:hypothetical protein n=1 Tax=Sutcliffiella tianshenii TaxID=1463404 RepID=UPI001CD5FF77|nr:hypothetical protein [Bacillus tianshenii]MCA1320686.1 hypothetical protein [Bacillus tianshenii]